MPVSAPYCGSLVLGGIGETRVVRPLGLNFGAKTLMVNPWVSRLIKGHDVVIVCSHRLAADLARFPGPGRQRLPSTPEPSHVAKSMALRHERNCSRLSKLQRKSTEDRQVSVKPDALDAAHPKDRQPVVVLQASELTLHR